MSGTDHRSDSVADPTGDVKSDVRGERSALPPEGVGHGSDSVADPTEAVKPELYMTAGQFLDLLEDAVGTGEEPEQLCERAPHPSGHLYQHVELGLAWCWGELPEVPPGSCGLGSDSVADPTGTVKGGAE